MRNYTCFCTQVILPVFDVKRSLHIKNYNKTFLAKISSFNICELHDFQFGRLLLGFKQIISKSILKNINIFEKSYFVASVNPKLNIYAL